MLFSLLAILKIFIINLVLSGDNAIVIAMACRNLPKETQKKGIILGTSGAVFFRIILTLFAAWLLKLPFLQLVCGVLLFWIGVKLLNEDNENQKIKSSESLLGAIKVIIVADFIMSLDNILGVAAAAQGDFILIVLGLLLSIPLVIFGSKVIMNLIKKWPFIVYLGASVIGYTAGDILLSDSVLQSLINYVEPLHHIIPILCIPLVLLCGSLLNKKEKNNSFLQKCRKQINK